MGVRKLWQLLEASGKNVSPLDLHGSILGIDFSCWICADKSVNLKMSQDTKLYLRNVFFRLNYLLQLGILPYAIFDGQAPDLKAETMKSREGQLCRPNQKPLASSSTKSSIKVTSRSNFSRVNKEMITLLNLIGIPSIVSPGEAEKLCAILNHNGTIDACVSNDGDCFLYGAERVLRNFSIQAKTQHIFSFEYDEIRRLLNLNRLHFIVLGLLCGCDYFPEGVPHIGQSIAFALIKSISNEGDVEKLLSLLRGHLDGSEEAYFIRKHKAWRRVFEHLSPFKGLVDRIIHEFISEEEITSKAKLPKRERLFWSRPDLVKVVRFFEEKLEWAPSYTISHLLPLIAIWDLRRLIQIKNPRGYAELSSIPLPQVEGLTMINEEISDEIRLAPKRIIKECRVNFIDYYLIEFEKMPCDIWSTGQSMEQYCIKLKKNEISLVHEGLIEAYLEEIRLRNELKKSKKPKSTRKKEKKVDDLLEDFANINLGDENFAPSTVPEERPEPVASGMKENLDPVDLIVHESNKSKGKSNPFSRLFSDKPLFGRKSNIDTSIISSCDEFAIPTKTPLRERLLRSGFNL